MTKELKGPARKMKGGPWNPDWKEKEIKIREAKERG